MKPRKRINETLSPPRTCIRIMTATAVGIIAVTFSTFVTRTNADSPIMFSDTNFNTTMTMNIITTRNQQNSLLVKELEKEEKKKKMSANNINKDVTASKSTSISVPSSLSMIRRGVIRKNYHRSLQHATPQCKIALDVGDSDRNDVLSKNEYLNVVNQLVSKSLVADDNYDATSTSTFDQLSSALNQYYDDITDEEIGGINISGSKPGKVPTTEQEIQLNELCEFTKSIAMDVNYGEEVPASASASASISASASAPTDDISILSIESINVDCSAAYDRGQCNVDLSISDGYQNNLLDKSDYVRFVNRISDNDYSGVQFEQLPQNIQENYNKFATSDGQVDISGSKPGQRVSVEQDIFLDTFCCETNWVVQNSDVPITFGPTVAPRPSEITLAPTFDLFFCQRSMASSDLDRDDKLNEDEYIIFLNRLTGNEFVDVTFFDELDTVLKSNFNNLAGNDGEIYIYGSKPGQTEKIEEEASLVEVCLDTAVALSGGSPPSVAPTADPQNENLTYPPASNESDCYSFIELSDSDRDEYLNEIEYIDFVNELSGGAFDGMTFTELPPSLQFVYEDLKSTNVTGIYINGSEQDIIRICTELSAALLELEEQATLKPSGPIIFFPGSSEIYNSFIIANKGGLTAANLLEGTSSRNGLDEAYRVFAESSINIVDTSKANISIRRKLKIQANLRRRKLEIIFLPNSNLIYLITDTECPDNLSEEETCQTVFAKFQVTITDENPQSVSIEYTEDTQALIAEGKLNDILKEVDPLTMLKVVDASFPVIPDDIEVTVAPTTAPTVPTEIISIQKKKLAGPIIGGILGFLLLCAIIAYISIKGCPFQLPFLRQGRGRVGNKTDDDDDDDEGGLGFGQDDDDVSTGDKDEIFGKGVRFGADNDAFGNNDAGEEKEQSVDGDRNVFGFAKKNKRNDEDERDFGLDESQSNSNAKSFGISDNMYAFEEPSEADSETENHDQRSVGDNHDIVFGGTSSSPAWDNTDNVFDSTSTNQGWGANGGEDNFFGSSAFGEEQNEDEEVSRSGSESESYSSDDNTYESDDAGGSEDYSGKDDGTLDEEQHSYSESSADDEKFGDGFASKSLSTDKLNSDLRLKNDNMDTAIENGDWDAVVQAANSFDKSDQESTSVAGSSEIGTFSQDDIEDNSYSDSYSDASTASATTATVEFERRVEYRAQVDFLVREVLPDETEKVDAMMDQFKGREAELVSTLQTMKERNTNSKARALVHKSKAYIGGANVNGAQRGDGSTAGNAAIAAASLPIPESGMFDNEDENSFDNTDHVDFERDSNFVDASNSEDYEDRSEYSDEDDRSYFSDEGSGSGEGSRSVSNGGSGSRSFYSEDGSRSYYSGEGSYYSGEE